MALLLCIRFVLYILLRYKFLKNTMRVISTTDNYYFYVEEFLFNASVTVFLFVSIVKEQRERANSTKDLREGTMLESS